VSGSTSAVDLLCLGFAALSDSAQDEALVRLRDIQLTRLAEAEGEDAVFLRAVRRVAELNGGELTPDIYKRTREGLLAEGIELPNLSAVVRHYVTWAMAKEAVGLSETTTGQMIEARFRRRLRGLHPHYRLEELRDALARCVAAFGRVPLVSEYEEWRQKELSLARTRGEVARVPGVDCFRLRFGDWAKALESYGYSKEEIDGRLEARDRARLRTKVHRYSDASLGPPLKACARALGRVPLVEEYKQWREEEVRRAPMLELPSDSPYRRRYGGWEGALRHFGFSEEEIASRLIDGQARSQSYLRQHQYEARPS
jgi:hypothetical protein